MAITPLPPAPLPTDSTAEFNSKAFALVAALDPFVTQTNATAVEVDADKTTATSAASTATTGANTATTQAGIATTQAGIATSAALEAAGLVENYQGALASDPSLNKDGGALAAGDWYVNTSTGLIRAYTGSVWVTSVNVTAGVTTFSAGTTGFTPSTNTQGAVTLAGTLKEVNGGTGQSTYAVGDLLVGGATNTLAKLADVATGNALISGGVGVAPSYGKIGLTTHVSGTLPVANGGTGTTTLAANNVLLGNGTSAVQVVAPGTSGNVLTSNGTTWTSATPADSGYKFITAVNVTNAASADFTTGFSATYNTYMLICSEFRAVTSSTQLLCRFRFGTTFVTSAYNYGRQTNGVGATASNSNAFYLAEGASIDSNAALRQSFILHILSANTNLANKQVHWSCLGFDGNNQVSGAGVNTGQTGVLTGIQFLAQSGNIDGKFRLYGLINS